MDRCFLAGLRGDATNAVLAAAGANMRKLLRRFFYALIRWLEGVALPTEPPTNDGQLMRDSHLFISSGPRKGCMSIVCSVHPSAQTAGSPCWPFKTTDEGFFRDDFVS